MVALECARFLADTVRADGSWPIDTNLATWVTTLSINALADGNAVEAALPESDRSALREWLLNQQGRQVHPFTHAAPGGWGWTSLPGAVPDGDDTPGVLVALRALGPASPSVSESAAAGVRWLLGLRNSDGGIPTFCRGWGKLPFDRSCPDLTAHALRAFDAWRDDVDPALRRRMDHATRGFVRYLEGGQQSDGSWLPLWFGNQTAPGQTNPTYGTAQVVRALAGIAPDRHPAVRTLAARGRQWLVSAQNADGGWGGAAGVPSSIEETALAVTALCGSDCGEAVRRGTEWLVRQTEGGTRFAPAPIGLYFARLWYSERLYPVIFTVQALGSVQTRIGKTS